MHTINTYIPPAPADLARLKEVLGLTSEEMADLAGLTQGGQWRKYTGGEKPRVLGKLMHFYMAALLTLDESDMARVFETMRGHGAMVETAPGPDLAG